MTRQLLPRVCEGCGKGKGTIAFLGKFWHRRCFMKARDRGDEKAAWPKKKDVDRSRKQPIE